MVKGLSNIKYIILQSFLCGMYTIIWMLYMIYREAITMDNFVSLFVLVVILGVCGFLLERFTSTLGNFLRIIYWKLKGEKCDIFPFFYWIYYKKNISFTFDPLSVHEVIFPSSLIKNKSFVKNENASKNLKNAELIAFGVPEFLLLLMFIFALVLDKYYLLLTVGVSLIHSLLIIFIGNETFRGLYIVLRDIKNGYLIYYLMRQIVATEPEQINDYLDLFIEKEISEFNNKDRLVMRLEIWESIFLRLCLEEQIILPEYVLDMIENEYINSIMFNELYMTHERINLFKMYVAFTLIKNDDVRRVKLLSRWQYMIECENDINEKLHSKLNGIREFFLLDSGKIDIVVFKKIGFLYDLKSSKDLIKQFNEYVVKLQNEKCYSK